MGADDSDDLVFAPTSTTSQPTEECYGLSRSSRVSSMAWNINNAAHHEGTLFLPNINITTFNKCCLRNSATKWRTRERRLKV